MFLQRALRAAYLEINIEAFFIFSTQGRNATRSCVALLCVIEFPGYAQETLFDSVIVVRESNAQRAISAERRVSERAIGRASERSQKIMQKCTRDMKGNRRTEFTRD